MLNAAAGRDIIKKVTVAKSQSILVMVEYIPVLRRLYPKVEVAREHASGEDRDFIYMLEHFIEKVSKEDTKLFRSQD